jgi:hypothetical protein
MKHIRTTVLLTILVFAFQSVAFGKSYDATAKIKKEWNKVTEKVEQAETADAKRQILNEAFDDMITAFSQVENIAGISQEDQDNLAALRDKMQNHQHELNGTNGFDQVQNNQLNNFSNYVQQDLEQADTITLSLTAALLIVIILLLL